MNNDAANVDHWRDRFETSWKSGQPPRIKEYLRSADMLPANARQHLLVELLKIDLNFRWRLADQPDSAPAASADTSADSASVRFLSQRPRLEDLVAAFPELGPLHELPSDLIVAEYRARWLWGDKPDHGEYEQRFPRRAEEILTALRDVDRVDTSHDRVSDGAAAVQTTPHQGGSTIPPTITLGRNAGSKDPNAADGATGRTEGIDAPPAPIPSRFGRYIPVAKVGEGAFGEVFKARDPQLDRDVAVKVARRSVSDTTRGIGIQKSEARSLAKLQHSGIVAVYDMGTTEEGCLFIVSEFVEGSDLQSKLAREDLPHEAAAELVAQVATALHHAHKRGFVHRDVKPANILIDRDGKPRLADFGLAIHESQQREREGELSGTAAYMAPEQIRRETHRLDGRADIWSLGVILYEITTGRRPFGGKTIAELRDEIVNREPKPPRIFNDDIPPKLETIILKCLSKNVTGRYTTANELAKDLSNLGSGSRRVPTVALSAVGMAILLTAWWFWSSSDTLKTPSPVPTSDAGAATGSASSKTPRQFCIDVFDVTHLREFGETTKLLGTLGVESACAIENDWVQVTAKFSQPAYCFLLAFNTDGTEQRCYPDPRDHPNDESAIPKKMATLRYPADDAEAFRLTEGAGQQAFLLFASADPLPSYAEWRRSIGDVVWAPESAGNVMRFDNDGARFVGTQRGTVGRLKGLDDLDDLCNPFCERASTGLVGAVSFHVERH